MLRILMAWLVLLMAGAARADDGRSNAMMKIAEAMAIASGCGSLEPDSRKVAVLAFTFGIDLAKGSADFEAVNAMALGRQAQLASESEETICQMGRMAYGRNGVNYPGLLVGE